MKRLLLLVALFALGLPAGAAAQQAQQAQARPAPAQSDARVNVDRLPLDLERIERQLRQTPERQDWDGFRLRYFVDVYGKAPRLQFFEPGDVLPSKPIPYGAPTHKEMVDMMTPKEYRAPAMDFSALMRWLQEKMK